MPLGPSSPPESPNPNPLSFLKCTVPSVLVHACNPSTWEAETGRSQVQGQPQQLSKTLFQNKKIRRAGVVAQR